MLIEQDTNLGLVDQVVSSMPARRVLQLQKTHSKMYLSDLARRLGFKSDAQGQERAARLLQGMVSKVFFSFPERTMVV